MLAELAACNLAYGTIKKFIGSGRELVDCSSSLIKYFDSKAELAKRVENKTGPKNELEEFLALEKIKAQEAELKQFMIYCGRPGLWQDWMSFQAKAARDRKDAVKNKAKAKYQRQKAIQQNLNLGIKVMSWLLVVIAFMFGVTYYYVR